jgi:hypothetical protein
VTHRERYGKMRGIQDPQVIADCGTTGTILLTADSNLETTWAAEITKAKIGIVILSNNTDGAAKWGQRIIQGMDKIRTQLDKRRKPCAICLTVLAEVNRVRLYRKKGSSVIHV